MIGYSFKKQVSIAKLDGDDIEILKEFFAQKKCKISDEHSDRIEFKIPFGSVGNWHVMSGVSSGALSVVSKGNVNYLVYEISILRFFIATLVLISVSSVFLMLMGNTRGILSVGAICILAHATTYFRQKGVLFQIKDLLV